MPTHNRQARRRQKARNKERNRERRKREAAAEEVAYPSREAAVGAAARAVYKSATGYLRPYRCPYCHEWHLTSKR